MWDYDSLFGKAQEYFSRAEEHSDGSEEFVLWMLLGLEFLLRAPLARIHPSLLAAPDKDYGTNILFACGITVKPKQDSKPREPKSIPTQTVIERLTHIVDGFTEERKNDATTLMNLRNRELHTGEAVLGSIATDFWLPRFVRVCDVICKHLSVELEDLIGDDVVKLGRLLLQEGDEKLRHAISKRIQEAKTRHSEFPNASLESRQQVISVFSLNDDQEIVDCPACKNPVVLQLEPVRAAAERLVDDELQQEVTYIAKALACRVCGLKLNGAAEARHAGLVHQYRRVRRESLADLYLESYVDDDYGND